MADIAVSVGRPADPALSPSADLSARLVSFNGGGGSSPAADIGSQASVFGARSTRSSATGVSVYLDGDQVETAMDTRFTRYQKVGAA